MYLIIVYANIYLLSINSKKIITKKNSSHGIAILNPSMNIFNLYFEFKVNIKNQKNYSHLLIDLVDCNKFTKNIYTFFKNSPSIFYWEFIKENYIKMMKIGKKLQLKTIMVVNI